ncbi:hypothetical protein CHS0354_025263 [Potamilus streckersoni]|uniref:Uncharacterized protein n=1 Tax=Potamilus streckersoni TaxID=2493646 RepID=A0AAE0VIW9_9BIVA|nr:hypothetical protein CHS0354_025263 [Potamilus streckersoni]
MTTATSGDETIVSSTTGKNEDSRESAVGGDKGRPQPGRLLINQDGTPFLTGDGIPSSQKCIMMPDENGQMKMFIVPTETPTCAENKVFIVAPLGQSSWKVKTAVGDERAVTSKRNQDDAINSKTVTSVEGTLSKVTHVHAISSKSTKVSYPSKSGLTSSKSAIHQDSALRSLLNEKPSNVSTVKITETTNPKLVTSKPSTASIKPKAVTTFAATKIVMPDGRIFTTLLPSPASASSLKPGDILTVQHGSDGNILIRQAPESIPVATKVTTSSALTVGSSLLSGISVAPKMSAIVNGLSEHTNESRELTSSHTTSSDANPVSKLSVIPVVKNVQVSSSPGTSAVSSKLSVPDISPPEKPYPMLLFSHEAATRIGMKKTTDLLNSCATKNTDNTTDTLSNQGHIMTSGNTSNIPVTSQNPNVSQIGLTSIFSSVAQSSKATDVNKSSVKPPQIRNCSTTQSSEVKVNTFPVLLVSNGTSAPTILVPANFVPPTSVTQSQMTSPVTKSLIPTSVSVSQASKGASQITSSMMLPTSTVKGLVTMPSSVVSQVSKVTILNPCVTSSATANGLISMPPSGTASQVSKVANHIPYVTVSTKGLTPISVTSGVSQVSRIVQNTNVLIPPSILSQNSQNLSIPAYAYAKISAPQLTTASTPAKVQTISWPRSTHPESILKTVAVTLPNFTHSAASPQVTPSVPLHTLTSVTRTLNHTESVENKKSESIKDEIRIDSVFSLSHIPEETTAMTNEDVKLRKCGEKDEKEEDFSKTKVSALDGSNSHVVSKKDVRDVLRLAISRKHAQGMEELNSGKSAESPGDKLKISGKKFRSISKRDVAALKHNSKTNVESLKELCKPCYVVLRKFHFRQSTVSAKYAAIYRTDRCRRNCREKALRKIIKRKRIVMEALHKAVTSVEKERKFISDVKRQANYQSCNSGDEVESQDKDARSVFSARSMPVTNVDKVSLPNNQTDAKNSSQNSRSLLFSASTMISDLVEKVRKTDMRNTVSISKPYTKSPAPLSVKTPIVVAVESSSRDRISSSVSSSGPLPGIPVMVRLPTTTASSTSQVSLSQSCLSSPSPANAQLSIPNSTGTFLPMKPTLHMNQVTSGTKVLTLTNQPTKPSQTGSTTILTSKPVIAKPSTTVTNLQSTISQVFTPQTSSNPIPVMVSPSPGQSLMTRLPPSGVMPSTVASKSTSGMQQRYYLIKVDNKNILIPANMSQQQPRAYIIPQKDSAVMPMGMQGKDSSISTTKGNITLVSVLPTGNKANQNVGSVSLCGTSASGPTQGKIVNPPNTPALRSSCPAIRVKSEPRREGYGDEESTIKRNEIWIKKEPVTSGYGDEGNSDLSSVRQIKHQNEQVRQRSVSGKGDSSGTKRKCLEDKEDRANRIKSMRLQSSAGEADFYSEVRESGEGKVAGSSDTNATNEISEHDGSKSLLTESGLSSHEDKIRRLKQLMQEKIKALEEFKRQRHLTADDKN